MPPILFSQNYLGSPHLMRSPTGLILGDAYTARATDDFTLFYNPATMGRNKTVSVNALNMYGSLTDPLGNSEKFENMPSSPNGVANRLLNFPIHAQVGSVPNIKFVNFAFSLLFNVDINAIVTNRAHPVLDLNYRYDNGFIFGAGFPLSKDSCGGTTMGASAKYIKRTGIDDRFPLVGTRILNAIKDDAKFADVLRDLGATTDKTWGFDLGFEYSCAKGPMEVSTGISALDIYTKFKAPEGKTLPEQPMTVNWGMSWKFQLPLVHLALSADLSPLNRALPYNQIYHLGAEVGTPLFSLLAGSTSAGLSYGASVNIFVAKLIGGFYHTNVGDPENPINEKRAMIYLSLLDFSFDGL